MRTYLACAGVLFLRQWLEKPDSSVVKLKNIERPTSVLTMLGDNLGIGRYRISPSATVLEARLAKRVAAIPLLIPLAETLRSALVLVSPLRTPPTANDAVEKVILRRHCRAESRAILAARPALKTALIWNALMVPRDRRPGDLAGLGAPIRPLPLRSSSSLAKFRIENRTTHQT